MRTALAVSALGLASVASASRFARSINSPLPDGFPSPNATQLQSIEVGAKGTLPNSSIPSTLAYESLSGIYLLEFAERIESFFYQELVNNITANVTGYNLSQVADRIDPTYLRRNLELAANTEHIHGLTLGAILANVNATALQPCETYTFPVTDLKSALNLAIVLTDASYGVLADTAQDLANNGDVGLVRPLAQTIAAEGEQGGLYRYVLNKTAEGAPFGTEVGRNMAWNALTAFVDLSSCPNLNILDNLLYFFDGPVTVSNSADLGPQDGTIQASVNASLWNNSTQYWAVLNNQLNLPVVYPINGTQNGSEVQFTVPWEYKQYELNGLTVLNIANSSGPFADVDGVGNATSFGPAFIVV